MIEGLAIQNFQAHEKLRLKFDPNITTIVGPTDGGKSAIIRALRWVATNQPGGDAFVRYGTKGTTVRLTVDGRTVTRKRGKGGVNSYHLDEEEFKAFGRGVPDTIAEFLNLPDVCWQGQHDPSFWFADSPGEVSRQLNAIVDLSVIDHTLKNVGTAFHRARTKLELAEEGLTTAKAEHDELKWVPDCAEALLVVEHAYGDSYAATGRAVSLRALLEAVQGHRARLGTLESRVGAATGLCKAAKGALDARRRADALRKALHAARWASEAAAKPVPNFKPVSAAARVAVTTRNRIIALKKLMAEIDHKDATLCQARKNLKAAAKAVPANCPTCGQSLPATSTSS